MDNEKTANVTASEIDAVPSEVPENCNEASKVDTSTGEAAEVISTECLDGSLAVNKTTELDESDQLDTSEAAIKQSVDSSMNNTSMNNASEQAEDKSEVAGGWPVPPVNNDSVDEEPSLPSENLCSYQQNAGDKPWPFPKHLDTSFQASSGLSRASSDADFCTVESFDGSKVGGSVEGSDQCSRSQSPLSYVIQLNEDSECSLPSEAGTSNVGPTDFNRILIGQVNCEAESIDDSSGLDAVAKQSASSDRADSADLLLEVESCSMPSDAALVKESSAQKAARKSRQRSRRVRKNKDKEEQDDNDEKSAQLSAKSRQKKKVSVVSEVAPPANASENKKGVFEYQWPPDDKAADWYLLQEHISEFLGVLSFKRKYPDIFRRAVDINERDFLQEQGVVTEMQCDLGLTALLADEVYDILERDYPEKFQEYAKVVHTKEKQKAADQHKASEMPTEKSKMETLMKKSVKSAAEFNASLMRELRQERRAYFDLQTFEVHYPQLRRRVLPKPATAVGKYPVAILPGQFQDYYKRYTPAELKYFPINTALYSPHKSLRTVYAEPTDVPATGQDDSDDEGHEVTAHAKEDEAVADIAESVESEPKASEQMDAVVDLDNSLVKDEVEEVPVEPPVKRVRRLNSRKKLITDAGVEAQPCQSEMHKLSTVVSVTEQPVVITCSVCDQLELNKLGMEEELVTCSVCARSGHPSCLDLTSEMIPIIKTYEWQCMECKACVKCMKPHDEEKMMFCDHCDRGYHTFCVGVEEIPEGRWECPSCTLEAATPPPLKAKRGRPFKYPRPVVQT